jgi:hypothetical protein
MLQYTILSLSYTRHRTAGKELGYYILAHDATRPPGAEIP